MSFLIFEWLSIRGSVIVGDLAQLKCLQKLLFSTIKFCNIAGCVQTSAGVPKLNNTYNSHLHRAIPRIYCFIDTQYLWPRQVFGLVTFFGDAKHRVSTCVADKSNKTNFLNPRILKLPD